VQGVCAAGVLAAARRPVNCVTHLDSSLVALFDVSKLCTVYNCDYLRLLMLKVQLKTSQRRPSSPSCHVMLSLCVCVCVCVCEFMSNVAAVT